MFEEWEVQPIVWWMLTDWVPHTSFPVFSHALFFDLVFCYAGQAGKSRKHGATSQAGPGKSRKDWAPPAWSLPRWARLVKAGRAGGHLAGLPAWSPHSSTGERVARWRWAASKQAGSYPAREQAGRAPTYFPTLSGLSCPVPSRCGQCISEHSVHTHKIDKIYMPVHTHYTWALDIPTYFPTFSTG